MSNVSELYALQETDSELDAARAALTEAESRIGETGELLAAREEKERLSGEAEAIRARLKDAEWRVDEVAEKIAPLEAKLYGGTVRNPKELADIQEDVDLLMRRKRKLEDAVLEVMAELEEAEDSLRRATEALNAVEEAWQEDQARLTALQVELDKKMASLEVERAERARGIEAGTLRFYDGLRAAHQGRAVSKVERGMCQGCRISLPMGLLQKARSGGDTLVQCSSCERILYVS